MMTQWLVLLGILSFSVSSCTMASLQTRQTLQPMTRNDSDTTNKQVLYSSKLPRYIRNVNIPFVENRGQAGTETKFYANSLYGTSYVTNDRIVHSIRDNRENRIVLITEQFLDGNGNVIPVRPQGEQPSTARISYFLGNNANQWHSGLSSWNLVNLGEYTLASP
jgi:hypothetical protein